MWPARRRYTRPARENRRNLVAGGGPADVGVLLRRLRVTGGADPPGDRRAADARRGLRLLAHGDPDVTRDGLPALCSTEMVPGGRRQRTHLRDRRSSTRSRGLPASPCTPSGSVDDRSTARTDARRRKDVDTVVVPAWQPGDAALDAVRAAGKAVPDNSVVGATSPRWRRSGSRIWPAMWTRWAMPAPSELHLYHLGLAGPARWADLRGRTAAARRETTTPRVKAMSDPRDDVDKRHQTS